MIEHLAALVPEELRHRSGEVFYSGRAAFSNRSPLYVLGLNPGSDPSNVGLNTVQRNIDFVINETPAKWSSYVDQAWGRRPAGRTPFQRRMQHLARQVGLDLRLIPSSNLVFTRSRRTQLLDRPWQELVDTCWTFHAAVIAHHRPRVLLCLGEKAARTVLTKLGGGEERDRFVEANDRRWKSVAWETGDGTVLLGLTHPGVADWTKPATNPGRLLEGALYA